MGGGVGGKCVVVQILTLVSQGLARIELKTLRFDEGLTPKTLALETLHGGEFT